MSNTNDFWTRGYCDGCQHDNHLAGLKRVLMMHQGDIPVLALCEECYTPAPVPESFKDLEITKLQQQLKRLREENNRFMTECLAILERRKSIQPIPFVDRREGE